MSDKPMTRREALKAMGTAAAATAVAATGLGTAVSCAAKETESDRKMKVLLLNGRTYPYSPFDYRF